MSDFDEIVKRFDDVDRALLLLLTKGDLTMTTVAEISAKVDALVAAKDAHVAEANEEINILHDIKAQLDAALAGGVPVDSAALQQISDKLGGVTTALNASTTALDAAGKAAAGTGPIGGPM
jgi:hypothetical protein